MVLTTKAFTFQYIPRGYGGKGYFPDKKFSTHPVPRLLWLEQLQDFVGSLKKKKKENITELGNGFLIFEDYDRLLSSIFAV